MATTVHYFGKIKSLEMVREIQEEFREIAQVSGWVHEMVDYSFSREGAASASRMSLKGIRITLSKSVSPFQLTFDKDGYLSHIYYDKTEGSKPVSVPAPRPLLHQVHTSTSLKASDPKNHVTLVKLLDYVKKRYVPNLEVIDNTGYWFSRDESALAPKSLELVKK
jgi:hypothetical protein